MPVINSIAESRDEVAGWRHELHKNPQTAYEETFALSLVKQKLTEWGIPFKEGLAKTGLVATIDGQRTDSGRAIGLRADMDALDITEKTNLPHASGIAGKMHACGHDGHTATLLGAAKYLKDTRNFNGRVHLVFQPAEEGAGGAHTMIKDGLFRDFPCDYIFGLHNWPQLEFGKVATRVGPLLASVDEFSVTIAGKGGHAAMPHATIDPMIVASQLVTAFQSIVSRNVDPIDTAVLSVTNINIGTGAFNIIAETGTLTGTVRTFTREARTLIERRIKEICAGVAQAFDADIAVDYEYNIDPTINTADGVALAVHAATKVVGADNVVADCAPNMGGEDFGAYLAQRPGAFILVGQRVKDENSPHNHGLHTPYYDFNDDIIPIGASLFASIVEEHMALDK